MPAPPAPRHRVAAALDAVRAGATLAEAAALHGVSTGTIKRYRAGRVPAAARGASKGAGPVAPPSRVGKRGPQAGPELPTSPALDAALEADGEPAAVLALIRIELAHACRKRAAATAAGNEPMETRWSKRIEELGKLVERLEPPAPPGEDEILRRLRALDVEAVALIERHLSYPITATELAP